MRFSGDTFTTRSHDSLKISNGKWCWWSRGIGGVTALDYLIEVEGLSLPDAVIQLTGPPVRHNSTQQREQPRPPPAFQLPPRHADNRRVFAYLQGRGIHPEIINHCIKRGQLYEDAEHHNCVFVGYDRETPRHAALRGTLSGSDFMGDVPGSDKSFSFAVPIKAGSGTLCVFECAIDALSYLSLIKAKGRDWRSANVLSLSGVYAPKRGGGIKLPLALEQYLRDNPQITTIILCLDNDDTGRTAARAIQRLLTDYIVIDNPPRGVKDYNELLHGHNGGAETAGECRSEYRCQRAASEHIFKEVCPMGLFSDIQDAARREARQAREQAEQAVMQQEVQPQPAPEPEPEVSAQPEQMPPAPVPAPEPQGEAAPQEQTAPEPEAPTTEVVSEPEPQEQPAPAAKRMSDAEAVAASTKRIQTEIENITRKNMKECVAEHLAGLCAKDALFAHKVVQPGKTLVDCFSYINQKAQKFAERERKDNGITESGIYGCAIPAGLVYQWAEEYFTNPVEKKPERKAPTKVATPAKTNRTPAKPAEASQPKVPPMPAGTHYEQMTLM